MRKNLSFLSAVLAAGMLMGGSVNVKAQNINVNDRAVRKAPKTSLVNKKTARLSEYSNDPSKVEMYSSNGSVDDFVLYTTFFYEYAKPGLVSVEKQCNEYFYSVQLNKFNENDMRCEKIDGGSENSFDNIYFGNRTIYDYDAIKKDFCIYQESFENLKDNSESEPEWEHDRFYSVIDVKRDEQNRIMSVIEAINDSSTVYSYEYTYGTGNGPTDIVSYKLADNLTDKTIEYKYSNMVWDASDNQVISFDFLEDDRDVNNRPLSYSYIEYDEGALYASEKVDITYDDRNRFSRIERRTFSDEEQQNLQGNTVEVYEYTDDFGSYSRKIYSVNDSNGDGVISEDEMTIEYSWACTNNELGDFENVIEKIYENGVEGGMMDSRFTYKYDDKNRMTESVFEEKYSEEMDYMAIQKVVFEYDDTATGIASVNRDNMNLKVNGSVVTFGSTEGRYMVCNADGKLVMAGSAADGWVSLENLPAGLYIVKVNGCAVKVIR